MEEISKSEKKQYRSSFGATILFSGVQFYQIIIRIVKSKFIALLIGPAGMGIASLLHTTTDLISATTNLGLKTSGVKSVATSYSYNDIQKIAETITVLRRLILLTGLGGMIICALFSPFWSVVSFGNSSYTLAFIFISLIILFEQLNNGELVLLQGMQRKKYLAKANIIGQTLSLLLTIPLYYLWGINAIVWVLVLSALVTLVTTKYYTYKLNVPKSNVSWKETFLKGKDMITLGTFLSLQFLMAQINLYIIRNYVSRIGGIEEVGLYSAGTAIVTTYLGLIFSAIATDYFPRLAATKDNVELKKAVHTQAEITILLFTPLIIAFIVFIKPIIVLLYSEDFLPIEFMLYWAIGATLFQAMAWAVSYTLLAKAKPSQFFLNELFCACYSVPLKLAGYSLWGLTGFGLATFAAYILYLIQVLIVTKKIFDFVYMSSIWNIFLRLSSLVLLAVIIKFGLPTSTVWKYSCGTIILIISSVYVLLLLDRRMNLLSLVKKRFVK